MVLAILIARPEWETPLLGLPLGAYLMGGAGGLITTVGMPGWARRVTKGHTGRVAVLTFYRLLCACLMGGVGFALMGAVTRAAGLVAPDGFLFLAALLIGGGERPANMAALSGMGFLEPPEINSRPL
jgi:hypothetical protein